MLSQPLGLSHTIRWALELAKYDIVYRLHTTIKAQVLADFLADFVSLAPSDEEWTLYIDGSSSSKGAGAGVILKSPTEVVAQYAVKLLFLATNNEAENEVLLSDLRIAQRYKVRRVTVHTDSQLVTRQITGSYHVKESGISTYLQEAYVAISQFDAVEVQHVPRTQNAHADALARLASATTEGIDDPITIEIINKPRPPVEILNIFQEDWRKPILDFITTGHIPDSVKSPRSFRLKASRYTALEGNLYKHEFNVPLLRCVDPSTT